MTTPAPIKPEAPKNLDPSKTLWRKVVIHLEGPYELDTIDREYRRALLTVASDPAALIEKWPGRTAYEAAELEILHRVRRNPPKKGVHLRDWKRLEEDARYWQNDRRLRLASQRRPSPPSRPRGRSRRSGTNSRRPGSRRTASRSGGSRGEPDDSDPSEPGDRDGRASSGRHCLGCGEPIDPERRSDARFCPGEACRADYNERGRYPADPISRPLPGPREPGRVREEVAEWLAYHEKIDRLEGCPANRWLIADLEGQKKLKESDVRLAKAAVERGAAL